MIGIAQIVHSGYYHGRAIGVELAKRHHPNPHIRIQPMSSSEACTFVPTWQHALESDDIDEFAGAQPDWSLRYEQLSSGRFAGRLQHVQLPGVRLVFEKTNCAVRQWGCLGDGHIGIAMPLALEGHATFNGQSLLADSLMIGRSEELDLCFAAGASMIGVVVEAELLGTLWEHMYGKRLSSWIDHQLVVQARPAVAAELRRLHLQSLGNANANPALLRDPKAVVQLRDEVLIEWIEAIPPRVDTDELGRAEARKRVVDRACALMLSRPEEPMTILQVCDRIGASPRKLEYCFRQVLGTTPAKYLRAARLNGVRRELRRQENTSVQDIAARWGFWHMGEFAAAYRRQFDELPSQTLRRIA